MPESSEFNLQELSDLFKDTDPEISERRAQAVRTVQENDMSSFQTEMSLMSAADDLIQCYAFGGQLRHYYRYNTYTNCAVQREKFWFALQHGSIVSSNVDVESMAKNPRELERIKTIQEFHKKKLLEAKAKGSSEDVWDERRALLEKPFEE